MPASAEVLSQLSALKTKIQAAQSGQGANFTLNDLGLSSADFDSSSFYPAPTVGPGAAATSAEWLELIRFFESHWVPVLQLRDLLDFYRYFNVLATALLQAKFSLNNAVLGSGLFVRMIRPTTVYANGGTAIETWATTVSAGWTTSFYTINLNKSSSTLSINTQNNVAMVVISVTDLAASPKLFEWQWYSADNKPLGVENASEILVPGSTGVVPMKQSMYIDKGQVVTVDFNFAASGESWPVLVGAEFVNTNINTKE